MLTLKLLRRVIGLHNGGIYSFETVIDYNFYIDESGHTGDQLINNDQRFFTMGAIGIPVKDESVIQDTVNSLKRKHRIDFELKGSKLIGTKFEPFISEIFNDLFEYNYLPVFTVLEKRFMVVAKIIENYFDPAYNDHTDNSWTFPIPIKVEAANYYYDTLTQETIELAAIAMQKGKFSDISRAFELILDETKKGKFGQLFMGAKGHLTELSEDLLSAVTKNPDQVSGTALNSPNYTIYFSHVNKIEELLRARSFKGDIVFDSSREFNLPFASLFKRIKEVEKKTTMQFPKGTLFFGLENLRSFHYKDSKDTVFIQLADLLSTSINSFFRKLDRHDRLWNLTANEEFWLGFIYVMLENDFGDWIISSQLKKKFGRFAGEFTRSIGS